MCENSDFGKTRTIFISKTWTLLSEVIALPENLAENLDVMDDNRITNNASCHSVADLERGRKSVDIGNGGACRSR